MYRSNGKNQNKSWEVIINKIGQFSFQKGITSFVNPYSMLTLRNREDIATAIDYWYVDGISLVERIKSKINKRVLRYSFDDTSLAPIVFSKARQMNLRIAVIGTEERLIGTAVMRIQEKYSVSVTYYRNGYFSSNIELANCIHEVMEKEIDLVICGMGTPFQEQFLIQLVKAGWEGYGFTCGGYLHQLASKESYYPPLFDKLNIRWVYRIIDEPKLFRRYFIDYPKFFFLFSKF